jgi:hypothetical protein
MLRQLKKDFDGKGEVKGYHFKQIAKSRYGYIYLVTGGTEPRYEVFEHKVNARRSIVRYPNANAFGNWAFTEFDLPSAKKRLKTLSEKALLRKKK